MPQSWRWRLVGVLALIAALLGTTAMACNPAAQIFTDKRTYTVNSEGKGALEHTIKIRKGQVDTDIYLTVVAPASFKGAKVFLKYKDYDLSAKNSQILGGDGNTVSVESYYMYLDAGTYKLFIQTKTATIDTDGRLIVVKNE